MEQSLDEAITCSQTKKECWMYGDMLSPHWGALACMALAYAYQACGDSKYVRGIEKCLDAMECNYIDFTFSEHAYYVLGTTLAAAACKDSEMMDLACRSADTLISNMGKAGNFPSQWRETPAGKHLVDTVYTQNWAVLGFQGLAALTGEEKYNSVFEKSLELLVSIQDKSEQNHLKGCWRGLYNLTENAWGGGDLFEGGANSIYTGWTNAPIAISLALALTQKSLAPQKTR